MKNWFQTASNSSCIEALRHIPQWVYYVVVIVMFPLYVWLGTSGTGMLRIDAALFAMVLAALFVHIVKKKHAAVEAGKSPGYLFRAARFIARFFG